jgi:hypothetical protein
MGADVKQTAEQFEKSQAKIKWADREANKKFFNGEIQAFNKEAAELLLEIGVIKSQARQHGYALRHDIHQVRVTARHRQESQGAR